MPVPGFVDCRHNCPGANACILNGRTQHKLHICMRPGCECHFRERYDRARALRLMRQHDERDAFEQGHAATVGGDE